MKKRGLIAAAAMGVVIASGAAAQGWSSTDPSGLSAYRQATNLSADQPDLATPGRDARFAPGLDRGKPVPPFLGTKGSSADVVVPSVDSLSGNPSDGVGLTAVASPIPEIPIWAMLLVGFAGVSLGIRHSRNRPSRCHLEDDI